MSYVFFQDAEIIARVVTNVKENAQLRNFIIAGVEKKMFIDSGCFANLFKMSSFLEISERAGPGLVKIIASSTAPKMMPFASNKPLKVLAAMRTEISPIENQDIRVMTNFYSIDAAQIDLLSHDTAVELKVLKVGYDECNPQPSQEIMNVLKVSRAVTLEPLAGAEEFPKFKGFQLKLEVDKSVAPRCQCFEIVKKGQEDGYEMELSRYYGEKIIEPAMNFPLEWVHPALAASKNHGKNVRVCIDLRALNIALIITHIVEMPTTASMLQFTQNKQVFAKIDLSSAFMHIELHPDSRALTTFYTRFGYFQYTRMPFGLKNAPWVFQWIMTELFKELKSNVMVYIDDILIAAKNLEELQIIFNRVMKILNENNFKVNQKKTMCGESEVEIVGFLASARGVSITEERLKVVKGLKQPTKLSELKSLLGFFGFFGHHIPNFARTAACLWKLVRSSANKTFEWMPQHTRALEELKTQSLKNNILSHFNKKLKTFVITDASEAAVGSILFQLDEEETNMLERIKIVSFASKILAKVFENFHQFEREIFGVVWSLNHFREYLAQLDVPCKVLTDLRTASIIMEKCLNHGSKVTQKRFERWILSVHDIPYTIHWIPGKMNVSDCPSRLSATVSSSKGSADFEENYVVNYDDDEKISQEELLDFDTPCYVCNVFKPEKFITHDEVARESESDTDIQKAFMDLRMNNKLDAIWKEHKQMLCEEEGVLIRGSCIVLPITLRHRALHIAHQSHMATDSMMRLLKEYVWWPGMKKDVEALVQRCEMCIMIRGRPTPAPMNPTPIPAGPWQHVGADFADYPQEGATILVMTCYKSRFVRFIPVRSKDTLVVTAAVDREIEHYGPMEVLRSDNGE